MMQLLQDQNDQYWQEGLWVVEGRLSSELPYMLAREMVYGGVSDRICFVLPKAIS